MPRTFSNVVIVAAALVLAALPVVSMRTVLHQHATRQAELALNYVAHRTLAHVDAVLSEAADALAAAAAEAHADCREPTRDVLVRVTRDAAYLRGMAVLGRDGGFVCGTGNLTDDAVPADAIARPVRSRALALAAWQTPAGRWRLALRSSGPGTPLLAKIAPDAHRLDVIPTDWRSSAIGMLALDDGTPIGLIPAGIEARTPDLAGGEVLTTDIQSERFPVRVSISVPLSTVQAGERSLGIIVDIGGGVIGVLFVVVVVNVVRRPGKVEDALRAGLHRDEFVPFYQPVFNIQTGKLVGCEVLIRWRRRDGTMIPPGAFIQKAEESGIAVEMTRSLMRKARDEVGPAYAARPDLKLAFNLFADHFSDLSTVEDIRDIFRTGGVRYAQLVFEVTERYPLPNLNRAKVAISGMQSLGCRVALDDAGTGHGGLAYLQKLGMDQIKIDKLFVDTITASSVSSPIVDSLCDLGRSLGMEIVAEGVENTDQLAYLKQRGVDCAQGFLFAKPLPGPSYLKLIAALVPGGAGEAARGDARPDALAAA